MSATPNKRVAWQPFTPRGVAAFAEASFDRFQVVKLLAALFCSVSVAAFLWMTCSPVILETIQALPETARLENGELKGLPGSVLRENRFVSVLLDAENSESAGQTADVQLHFGRLDWSLCALRTEVGQYILGCANSEYPRGAILPLSRSALEPWWGAWHGILFAATGLAVFLALLVSWITLAMVYTAPVRLVAFLAGRRITWGGSWRLAGAAMIPGAVLMALGFWAYGLFLIDLVRFLLIFVLHLVVGWAYLIAAPLSLDPAGSAGGPPGPGPQPGVELKKPKPGKNPFAV